MWGNFGKCGAGAPIYADVCVYVSFNVKHACEVVEVCASSENVYACMYADKKPTIINTNTNYVFTFLSNDRRLVSGLASGQM